MYVYGGISSTACRSRRGEAPSPVEPAVGIGWCLGGGFTYVGRYVRYRILQQTVARAPTLPKPPHFLHTKNKAPPISTPCVCVCVCVTKRVLLEGDAHAYMQGVGPKPIILMSGHTIAQPITHPTHSHPIGDPGGNLNQNRDRSIFNPSWLSQPC